MLYVIVLEGNIIAASDDFSFIKSYLYETLENSEKYEFFKVKEEEMIDRIESDENILLHNFNGIIITGYELNFILKHIKQELTRTKSIIDDLKYIMDNYLIDKRDKRLFKETRRAMLELRERDTFIEAIDLKKFIQYIHQQGNYNYLQRLEDELNYGKGILY